MKMVRKQDNCVDRKWVPIFHGFKRLFQQLRIFAKTQYLPSLVSHHRKEVRGARCI